MAIFRDFSWKIGDFPKNLAFRDPVARKRPPKTKNWVTSAIFTFNTSIKCCYCISCKKISYRILTDYDILTSILKNVSHRPRVESGVEKFCLAENIVKNSVTTRSLFCSKPS